MGDSRQNTVERLQDAVHLGKMTVDQANVEMVRRERFRLIIGKCPRMVRTALNAAVKAGELGHLKRDGAKPEAYFHPKFEQDAIAARNEHERDYHRRLASTGKIMAHPEVDAVFKEQ